MSRLEISIFAFGVMIGMFTIMLVSGLPGTYHAMARDAIKECEATLPRNQNCMVIAVPKQEENK